MLVGASAFPMFGDSAGLVSGAAPRITSLLIKPASAVCNLDCSYCFYLDRDADPYKELPARRMPFDTLERLVDTWLFYSYPTARSRSRAVSRPSPASISLNSWSVFSSSTGAMDKRSAIRSRRMPC